MLIALYIYDMIGGKKKVMTRRMYDEGGVMRQGKEAVEMWRSYFEKVLNEGGNSEDKEEDMCWVVRVVGLMRG